MSDGNIDFALWSRPRPGKRYFTPMEANGLLPQVLERMERLRDVTHDSREILDALRSNAVEGDRRSAARRVDGLRREARELLDSLHDDGVQVKGIDKMLVDFPALFHGREVCLCWREGDETVSWWHPSHEGASKRQPIDAREEGSWAWWS